MAMINSHSNHSFYVVESSEEDEEKELGKEGKDDGHDSDSSYSIEDQIHSRTASYTTAWPQSYRQSMDMYSSVQSPNMGFLGTSSLSTVSGSFLSSSSTKRRTSEVFSSIVKPLLPTAGDGQHHDPHERQSSHMLSPQKIPSLRKDQKPSKISHDIAEYRHCSFGQSVINGINVLCGVGILSTPYAIKEGGWLGLFVLFIFAFLSYQTGIMLRRCLDSQPGLETYPDIGQAAFGAVGRIFISIILYVELYACCVEYIILESDNLSSLFPNAHMNVGGFILDSNQCFALLTTIVVLPTVWLRDLSLLSYISAGGVIASVLVVLCLFWVGIVDHIGFRGKGSMLNLPTFPVAVGLYGYCYSGHAVLPNIYSSMKKQSQYPFVLVASFGFCTLLYAGAAVMGYMMYGESTLSQFTLNMPNDLFVSKIAVWTTVVNPFTKYALTMMPVALSFEELMPSNNIKSYVFSIAIRTTLVLSTLLVALIIPFFGLVMALIGSLLTMLVSLILPCACYLSIMGGSVPRSQIILCVLVILVGVVSSISGTYSALWKIIQNLR